MELLKGIKLPQGLRRNLPVWLGLAGIGLIAAALPLYNRITRREREKLAPLVLELTRDADPPAPGGTP